MALSTIVTEIILHMIRISHTVEVIFVAGEAISRSSNIALGMAIDTLQREVRSGQWELGLVMIESSRLPSAG